MIGLGIGLRAACFQGYTDYDPERYAQLADLLSQGRWQIPGYPHAPVFPLRIGVYGPSAFLLRYAGVSEVALVLYPFVLSILSIGLAYAFGCLLFGPMAGLLAALLYAVIPIDAQFASTLWPDPIAAFWGHAGVFLVLAALRTARAYHAWALAFAAGGAFGLAWLSKESVILLGPVVLLLAVFSQKGASPKRRAIVLSLVALSAGVFLFREMFFYFSRTGDFFFRFHEIQRNTSLLADNFFTQGSSKFGWGEGEHMKVLLKRLFIDGPRLMLSPAHFGAMPLLAVTGAIYGLLSARSVFRTPLIWLAGVVAMLNFGSTSFTSYSPMPLVAHYFYLMIVPGCVVAGGFLAHLSRRRVWKHGRLALLVATALLMGAILVAAPHRLPARCRPPFAEIVKILRPSDIVYTDMAGLANLSFKRTAHFGGDPNTRTYFGLEAEDLPEGAYIVLRGEYMAIRQLWFGKELKEIEASPPEHWPVVWEKGVDRMLRVEPRPTASLDQE